MEGTYVLLTLLICSFILWPEETRNVLTSVSLKIQIFYINYRTKWMAWRMYRSLVKLSKDAGYPAPGPFKYVDLWDREPLD